MNISEDEQTESTNTRAYTLEAFVPSKKIPTNIKRLSAFFRQQIAGFHSFYIHQHSLIWKFFFVFLTLFLFRPTDIFQTENNYGSNLIWIFSISYLLLSLIFSYLKRLKPLSILFTDISLILSISSIGYTYASLFLSAIMPIFYIFHIPAKAGEAKWRKQSVAYNLVFAVCVMVLFFLHRHEVLLIMMVPLLFLTILFSYVQSCLGIELKKFQHSHVKTEEAKHQAVLEERYRLARDIHDGLGASISSIIIQSEYIGHLVKDEKTRAEIDELHNMAEESMYELRRSLTMMRSEFELVPSLEDYCIQFESRHKIKTHLRVSFLHPFELPNETQLAIFRILQEALHNVVKHASAHNVYLSLETATDSIQMIVSDDGKGFDMSKTVKHHYGLQNMKDRAKKIQGEITIQSAIGQGTKVSLILSQSKHLE